MEQPPIEQVSGPGPKETLVGYTQNTQINFMFPATEVELPPADRFAAYPPAAQAALLAAFQREQSVRHQWLMKQQINEHELNIREQGSSSKLRMTGMICGTLIVLSAIILGAWLIKNGAGAQGITVVLMALTGLVGTALYGHRAASASGSPVEKNRKELNDSKS